RAAPGGRAGRDRQRDLVLRRARARGARRRSGLACGRSAQARPDDVRGGLGGPGVTRDRAEEVVAAEGEQRAVADRRDPGRARDVMQQRDLAEVVARALPAQPAPGLVDVELALGDDVEARADVVLADDLLARG